MSIKYAFIKRHPVAAYYALVFAISWGGMLIAVGPSGFFNSTDNPVVLAQFVYLAALAGPSVAGILMTGMLYGKAGLHELRVRLFRWRVGAGWYLVALLTAPLLTAAILFVLSLTSPAYIPPIFTTDNKAHLLMSGIVLGLVVGCFEELGWTGFVTAELRKRHGVLATGTIMGLLWGAWHYPLFSGSANASGAFPPALYLGVLLFSFLPAYRVLMVWVYDRTMSLLVVMLMHAPLAAVQLILIPPTLSGLDMVTFDLAFAAALWVVVAAVCLHIGRSPRGNLPSAGQDPSVRSAMLHDSRGPALRSSGLPPAAAEPKRWVAVTAIAVVFAALWIAWRFNSDIKAASAKAAQGSVLIDTRCGLIEYQEVGSGIPLLMVHGSGGGHDQGMAFAGTLAEQGIRVIAMSRFGYLRTPMPLDTSATAQAEAHVCLLDALEIRQVAVLGGSAGAPSVLRMAIDHADRVSALILLVPLAYKPPAVTESAAPLSPWVEKIMMRMLGSDFLFWVALHVARDQVIKTVLATPPELLATASAQERARINAMLNNILPVSARAVGLRSDTLASKRLQPSALELIRAPTLIISTRDDGYGTYASSQYTAARIVGAKFVGFETGGHMWVGHDDAVQAEILKLLAANVKS